MYVMTLGELNYHDEFLPWDELAFPTLTNVLFVILVLGMPIIMMNMLVCTKSFSRGGWLCPNNKLSSLNLIKWIVLQPWMASIVVNRVRRLSEKGAPFFINPGLIINYEKFYSMFPWNLLNHTLLCQIWNIWVLSRIRCHMGHTPNNICISFWI